MAIKIEKYFFIDWCSFRGDTFPSSLYSLIQVFHYALLKVHVQDNLHFWSTVHMINFGDVLTQNISHLLPVVTSVTHRQ